MERNTVIGIILLGLLLTVFTIVNQPSEEEQKEQQKKELALKQKQAAESKKQAAKELKKPTETSQIKDSLDTIKLIVQTEEILTLENEKLLFKISSKGGILESVFLKQYKSYTEFANLRSDPLTSPGLCLFKKGDNINTIQVSDGKKTINSAELFFEKTSVSKNKIVLTGKTSEGKSIIQTYAVRPNSFEIDYSISLQGFENSKGSNVALNWKTDFLKTERLMEEQRRVSTICYNQKTAGFDYLSETSDDEILAEDDINWISYKQSYFTSILRPDKPILKNGSKMVVRNFGETEVKYTSHIKSFNSTFVLGTVQGNETNFKMNWYFGPNDFKTLSATGHNYDEILNFGWGLFRWINVYAVQPIFSLLVNNGIGVGIAILLLTLILKLILMPIQWKMFTSSVKMRILKPEIDELNAKFPNKEDAMKKQMEMMNLYKESGASPLAGCVPMLIQMPILLAVFRFFPAAFELRQQSFLWAEDLSSFDSIYDLGFSIPLYGDHISLFTLLMSAVTLLYTFMNSGNMQQPQQPGMPNMKVIMYIFPVMMIFFFNNYSAGLSYYYFISTLISIFIMLAIKYFFVDEEKLKLKMAEKKAKNAENGGKEKKKSRFQEKLEEMQRKQQEMLKNKKK
jgi:YidC/Oxa1 family membrane protein insertase